MEDRVFLTKDQLYEIRHMFVNNLEYELDNLRDLCKNEKPDINIGFELGIMYNDLNRFRTNLVDLLSDISDQNDVVKENNKRKNGKK